MIGAVDMPVGVGVVCIADNGRVAVHGGCTLVHVQGTEGGESMGHVDVAAGRGPCAANRVEAAHMLSGLEAPFLLMPVWYR